MNLAVEVRLKSLFVGTLQITNDFVNQIHEAQHEDQFLQEKVLLATENGEIEFEKDASGLIRFKGRIRVPQSAKLRTVILEEEHKSRVSFHPGMTKIYQDLKGSFCGME